jgi:nascent polypeptide-associated complex subunit alpha
MFGGMNPSQIQGMMKKMGIAQTELPVKRVIFEMEDSKLVIDDPNVLKISMQGQVTYQVSGEAHEESAEVFSEDDVEMVMQKTGRSKKEVVEFLKENDGDIALAIMELKK